MDVEIKHGTISGYKYRACRCQLCRKASVRYEKGRRWLVHQGLMPTVSALGFKRRVRALMAIGWTQKEIAAELGIAQGNLALKLRTNETVRRATHETAVEVYERLCMTVRTSVVAGRTARIALKNGWPPPLAWDDIDDPNEQPTGVRVEGKRRDLLAEWHDLRDAGESIEQAAVRLGVTVGAIERAEFRRKAAA